MNKVSYSIESSPMSTEKRWETYPLHWTIAVRPIRVSGRHFWQAVRGLKLAIPVPTAGFRFGNQRLSDTMDSVKNTDLASQIVNNTYVTQGVNALNARHKMFTDLLSQHLGCQMKDKMPRLSTF